MAEVNEEADAETEAADTLENGSAGP